MIYLRSTLYNVLFVVWSTVMAVVGLPVLLAGHRAASRYARFWLQGVQVMLRWIAGIRPDIRGMDRLPAEPCLIAAKHQSAWETMIFHPLLGDPAFVLKKELLSIPLVGRYFTASGCVAVDRAAGAKALKHLVADAANALARGQYLVIFPEGTRVPPGQTGRHHPGVTALYSRLDVPVVPVALNSGCYWGRNAFIKHPGRVVMEFLEPIPPGLDRRDFSERLWTALETETRRLEAEACGKPCGEEGATPHQGD